MNNRLIYMRSRTALGFSNDAAKVLYDAERQLNRGTIDIRAAEDGQQAVIRIYEEIGFDWWTGTGMTAEKMAGILDEIDAPDILVRINSPGGSVFDGIAIYNLLAERREEVTTRIDGIAASAASIVAMAGDNIEAKQNAEVMVHSAWTVAVGNAREMREVAEVLQRVDSQLAETYAARSGAERSEIDSLMAKDSYLTATEAQEFGLVDTVLPLKQKPDSAKDTAGQDLNAVNRAIWQQRIGLAKAAIDRRTLDN